MKHGNYFEYIASGVGLTRIVYERMKDDPALLGYINHCFSVLNDNGRHFGLLYNAYQEPRYGPMFKDWYMDSINSLYADSGGLQIITQGKAITDELKSEVYTNQGNYSTHAMCFDEIPLRINGKSKIGDTTFRFFDPALVDDASKMTGQNMLAQIRRFEEMGSNAQICMIVQGNDLSSFQQWTDNILKEIPSSLHHHIGPIAISSAALGGGLLEDIERSFYFTQLPIQRNHLHMLGVGSVSRLYPSIVFAQTGVYKDLRISYDSTSHTFGIQRGQFYTQDGAKISFPKEYNHTWKLIYDDIVKYFGFPYDLQYFYEMSTTSPTKNQNAGGKYCGPIYTSFALFVGSVFNFMLHLKSLETKERLLEDIGDPLHASIFNGLYQVQTMDDFNHWMKEGGRFLKSSKIKRVGSASEATTYF